MAEHYTELVEELLITFRALRRLGLIDVRAHFSARLPEGDSVLVTPGYGPSVPPPAWLRKEDLVQVDMQGRRLAGRWASPRDLEVHLQVYKARPDIRAVLYAQPRTVLAFMAAGAELRPLTHVESFLVIPPLPRFGSGELITGPEHAAEMARVLDDRPCVLLPGQGVVYVGISPVEAGMHCYKLELLAKVNAVATTLPTVHTVGAEDVARITSQQAGAEEYLTYLRSVAGPDPQPPASSDVDRRPLDEAEVRARVVQACRLLYARGMVEHLEHVSHRLPDGSGFLITPRKNMGQMGPGDLAMVDMEGRWVSGPLPPPPFRFLHRDMFQARPEVQAIVHTHQLYGRAYAIAGEPVLPLYRAGASMLREPAPIYPVPDLIFDEEHRRGTLAALGTRDLVNERSHGIDFLAPTIEAATVAAVQYEEAAKLQHQARSLGIPRPLPPHVLERLEEEEPPAEAWWRDYLTDLEPA